MKIFLLLVSFLISVDSFSQVAIEWVARYSPGLYVPESMAIDSSGNVYIAGHGNNFSNRNFIVIKYNAQGEEQWVSTYDGPNHDDDYVSALCLDNLGNVYVTGNVENNSVSNSSDFATLKYNSQGVLQWAAISDPGNADWSHAIAVDAAGNVLVTGIAYISFNDYDYYTIKYNTTGQEQWSRRYDGPAHSYDYSYAIAVDLSGQVYVTGGSPGTNTEYDFCTIKYSSTGTVQWVTRYPGPFSQLANSIATDKVGNVYVTGKSYENVNTEDDYCTIKYNSSGVQLWIDTYNNSVANDDDHAYQIELDEMNNVYVSGSSKVGTAQYRIATIKYNSNGIRQWVQVFNENVLDGFNRSKQLAVDNLENVYVGGSLYYGVVGLEDDYVTIKYNALGLTEWIRNYNGPANLTDRSVSIKVDRFRNVYVTGVSVGLDSTTDIVTIKYSQSIGITNISAEIPNEFQLQQNYPNPFNPITNINFSLPKKSDVKLTVIDINGKKIAKLVDEILSAGEYNYEFNAENFPSGIYFYKLDSENFIETKKMILLK